MTQAILNSLQLNADESVLHRVDASKTIDTSKVDGASVRIALLRRRRRVVRWRGGLRHRARAPASWAHGGMLRPSTALPPRRPMHQP